MITDLRLRKNRLDQRQWVSQLRLEPLEDRSMLSVNWDGGGNGTSFSDRFNWDTDQVPTFADDAVINFGANTIVANGGFNVKSLTSVNNFSITGGLFQVNANSTVSGNFAMSGGQLVANGAGVTLNASSTTTLANASLTAQAGATISLPNLTTYTNTSGTTGLVATGTNSKILLNGLTSLTTSNNALISLQALLGGQVSLTSLTSVTTGPVQFIASGASSQINASNLTTFNGTVGFNVSSIQVSGGGQFLHGTITSLTQVDLSLDGATTTLAFPGLTSLTNLSLTATGGGTLTLPSVTSYTVTAQNRAITATGASSQVLLAGLTTFSTANNVFITVTAQTGGKVAALALTQITTGPVQFIATGATSQIDVSSLTTFNGTAGFNPSLIQVASGGAFLHGTIASMDWVNISLDGAATTLAFAGLTSLSNASLTATSGGTLTLPSVTSYSNTQNRNWLASGTGSQILLAGLTSLGATGNSFITITAQSAGKIAALALTQITTGPVQFIATGTSSQIDVSNLTTFNGTVGFNPSLIQVSANGTFLHGTIASMNWVDISLDGATTTLGFAGLTNLSNSNLTASGGGTLSLPSVTGYTNSQNRNWLANGAGSQLVMAGLTGLNTSGNSFVTVTAISGGKFQALALTQMITGPIQFVANGATSQIDVSNLTTFNGTAGFNQSLIQVLAGGQFLHGAITSLDRVDIALDGAATTIAFAGLTTLTNSNLSANGGGTLSLPSVTSYSIVQNRNITASGAGSQILLAGLTNLSTTLNTFIQVSAQVGGKVAMLGLNQVLTGPVQFVADGTNSQIDVSNLNTLHGTMNFNNSLLQVANGGTILHGTIPTLDRVDISVSGATSTLGFSGLTSFSNGHISALGGATLSIPSLTSFSVVTGNRILTASGAGSQLLLPGLTSLSTSGGNFITIQAQSQGVLTLAGVQQITTQPVQLKAEGNGQLNLPALTLYRSTANNSSISQLTGGTVNTGNNANTIISNITLTTDGTYTLNSNQTYYSNQHTPTTAQGGTVAVQGSFRADTSGIIDLNGNLQIDSSGIISSEVAGEVRITGNLLGNTTNNAAFNAQGLFTFDGTGTVGTPQQLEAMSGDLGAVQSGFNSNFAYGTLALANNTRVRLVNSADNKAGAGNEAVYVKKLIVPVGTTLDLNGFKLYVRDATNVAGTIIGGSITQVNGSVVANQQIFYNTSSFDAPNQFLPYNHDNAVATDKTPLLPGNASIFGNVSSYTRGINGIIVDLTESHPGITASDFVFKVGNNNTPSLWTTAPAPTSVIVRPLAGTGADRVEIIWADNAIRNTWLQVLVKANANTGLSDTAQLPNGDGIGNIFFFGNRVGDSGSGDSAAYLTSATDEIGARNNPGSSQPITNRFDYNKDGLVTATDQITSRNNPGILSFLNIANPPAAPWSSNSDIASLLTNNFQAESREELAPAPRWLSQRLEAVGQCSGSVVRLLEQLGNKAISHQTKLDPGTRLGEKPDSLALLDEVLGDLLW